MTKPETRSDRDDKDTIVSLYKAYLDDLGRIGSRHETLRQFYISVISALFVFLSLAGEKGLLVNMQKSVQIMVGLVGIIICVLWFLHMRSFADIYKAKKVTLCKIEEELPAKPFSHEGSIEGKRTRITDVDKGVALAFVALFAALIYIKVN